MAKSEFVQLAHVFDPAKHCVGGWYMSEKLDGQRAVWDGGITRGLLAQDVPFANTEKDGRYVALPRATGLWSRYGKVIHAPDWWLDKLPKFPLDGELYVGRGGFQTMRTICSRLPENRVDADWKKVRYLVLDTMPFHVLFGNRKLSDNRFKMVMACLPWIESRRQLCASHDYEYNSYRGVYYKLKHETLQQNDVVILHEQQTLPVNTHPALELIRSTLDTVVSQGGEGLVLRNPSNLWIPQRTYNVLKVKPELDDEAIVIGYVSGRRTDLGSKLLGLMGALVVKWRDITFELSGFTNEEREFNGEDAREYAASNPGVRMPDWVRNPTFPIGSQVTFKYRELSDDGIPKEARFYRV